MTLLSAREVSFGYRHGTPILDRWSGDFIGGETVAITAESGRGKSTLLYLLGLMLRPCSGAIVLDGDDVSGLSDAGRSRLRAETFGFVFQDHALDPARTVLDNVVEGALYSGRDRLEAQAAGRRLLERFGVTQRSDARPGEISGGQAQRIALCRALVGNPRVLLADEPTGNLDVTTAGVIMEALEDHARSGAVVIVVTHDPRIAERCDRRVEL